MKGFHQTIAVVSIALLSGMGTALPQTGNGARISANIETQPVVPVTAEERRAVFIAAGRVLKHVDQARAAIAGGDDRQAEHHIRQAHLLTRIIQQALPTYQVNARIESGDLVYQDEERIQQRVVPVFDELEPKGILDPVRRALESSTEDEGAMHAWPTSIRAALDIGLAQSELNAALAALEEDTSAADAALASIQAAVELTSIEADAPLERARTHLMAARMRLEEGRVEDAQISLRTAIDALMQYGRQAQQGRADSVTALVEEMRRLDELIHADQSQARELLTAWWDALSRWSRGD